MRTSAWTWATVGEGIVPVKPPKGSASRPLSKLNTAASAEVCAASRSGAPSCAFSSCGISGDRSGQPDEQRLDGGRLPGRLVRRVECAALQADDAARGHGRPEQAG